MHDPIRLALLGPIQVYGTKAGVPRSDRAHKLMELLAWLALHPHGAYGCEIDRDLILSPQSRMATVSRLRGWVGGETLPVSHGGGRYTLQVSTDWSRVQAQVCDCDGVVRRDTSTGALLDALRLVRGVPLADVGAPWADGPRLQMVLLLRDVACALLARPELSSRSALEVRAIAAGLLPSDQFDVADVTSAAEFVA